MVSDLMRAKPTRQLIDARTRRGLSGEALYDGIIVGLSYALVVYAARFGQAHGWWPLYVLRNGNFSPGLVFLFVCFCAFWLSWRLIQQYLITFTELGVRVPRLRGPIMVPWSSIKRIRLQRRQLVWLLQLITDDTVIRLRSGYYDDLPGLMSFLRARAPNAQVEGFRSTND
jgi:hypothetical protein